MKQKVYKCAEWENNWVRLYLILLSLLGGKWLHTVLSEWSSDIHVSFRCSSIHLLLKYQVLYSFRIKYREMALFELALVGVVVLSIYITTIRL